MIYSDKYVIDAVICMIASILFITLNILIISKTLSYMKFCKRYDIYINIMKYHALELIEDLVVFSKQTKDVVVRDLMRAVKQKYIPQGHFSSSNVFLWLQMRFMIDIC